MIIGLKYERFMIRKGILMRDDIIRYINGRNRRIHLSSDKSVPSYEEDAFCLNCGVDDIVVMVPQGTLLKNSLLEYHLCPRCGCEGTLAFEKRRNEVDWMM